MEKEWAGLFFPRERMGRPILSPVEKLTGGNSGLLHWGGGILRYFHINVGSEHKNEYFGGMKILWILMRGHYKKKIGVGVISIHFRAF